MVTHSEALMLVSEITEFLKQSLGPDVSIGARLKFIYRDVGVVMIDGNKTPNVISNKDDEADCTVEIDPATHLKLLHGELDHGQAFRQGFMKISGDVAVAIRLEPLLSRSRGLDIS